MNSSKHIPRIITWGIIALLLALVAVKVLFIGHYKVPQNGMYPLIPAGSSIWTAKRAYGNPSNVRRGDVIVFTATEDSQQFVYIWRVVGLPGESIHTSGDLLSINGTEAQRQPVRNADQKKIFREQIGNLSYEVAFDESPGEAPPESSVTVPDGHFFVLGDNRHDAHDSRYMGTIPFASIVGRKL